MAFISFSSLRMTKNEVSLFLDLGRYLKDIIPDIFRMLIALFAWIMIQTITMEVNYFNYYFGYDMVFIF